MEYKIKELIYSFFRTVPDCVQMRTLRAELTRKMIRRYYGEISAGKTPGEAYDAILSCAQEIKDRIADAMRNVRAAHQAPPFTSANRTERTYHAHTQSANARSQHRQETAERKAPQGDKNKAHSRCGHVQADKPAKKAISIPTALVIALAGAALTALVACGMFFLTQTAFSNSRINANVQTPVMDVENAESTPTDTGITRVDSDAEVYLDDAVQGYRDMAQSFSEDGAYAIDASHLTQAETLEIKWPAGNIQVHVYDGSDFLVLESAEEGITQQQALCCGLEGNALFVQYCAPQAVQTALPVKDLEIMLPQTMVDAAVNADFEIGDAVLNLDGVTFDAMQIHAKDGAITAQQFNITGTLNIETVSANASISGQLENVVFSSDSGSLQLDGGDVLCSVEAQTQSGNINVNANIHRMRASAYSGKLSIQSPICPYALDLSTRTGDIALTLPSQSDFTLDFSSDSGNLISELSVVEARGAYVRGDGIAGFHVKTVSGDLQICAYTQQ